MANCLLSVTAAACVGMAVLAGQAPAQDPLITALVNLESDRYRWGSEPARGSKHEVLRLIAGGADVNAKRLPRMDSALHIAVSIGDADIVRALLERKAAIDVQEIDGYSPLLIATMLCRRQAGMVGLLLEYGARANVANARGSTPLHFAYAERCQETIRALLSHGADIQARDKAGLTPIQAEPSRLLRTMEDFRASKGSDKEKLKARALAELVSAADVNARMYPVGDTALSFAVSTSDTDIALVHALLERGADANGGSDYSGAPINIAAKRCDAELVKLLLKHGARLGASGYSARTPLLEAASGWCGREALLATVDALIDAGADVNARDRNGRTALALAVERLDRRAVELLLDHGADTEIRDAKSLTALELLQSSNQARSESDRAAARPRVEPIEALLQGKAIPRLDSPYTKFQEMLAEYKSSPSEKMRLTVVLAAQKLKPAPAPPPEAEEAEGRALFIFKNAKSEDNYLEAVAEYRKAILAAPWIDAYYYNICRILEKTIFVQQAARACREYLEVSPDAKDASEIRQLIAGFEHAYDLLMQEPRGPNVVSAAASGMVARQFVAIKLIVNWNASPPKYQVLMTCEVGDERVRMMFYDLGITDDISPDFCRGQDRPFRLMVNARGEGFVEISAGPSESLRTSVDALFMKLREKVLTSSSLVSSFPVENAGPGKNQVRRFYAPYFQTERSSNPSRPGPGLALFETDCRGRLLNDAPRAMPDLFLPDRAERSGQFTVGRLLYEQISFSRACQELFNAKTGYSW